MIVFKTRSALWDYLAGAKAGGRTLGLVPTMGALHEGHLALVRQSVVENGLTAVSIFVNPIQFNNPADLEKYPRNLEADLALLEPLLGPGGVVFAPAEEEMYPQPVDTSYAFGALAEVMEGAFRPGHFNGVGIVVNRLFRIFSPDRAYFGEKDFQQLAIIRKLVSLEGFGPEIIPCPTVREPDGLAMSSRNQRLTAEQRAAAPVIYRALSEAARLFGQSEVPDLQRQVIATINATRLLKVEYVEFADEETLTPVYRSTCAGTARCFVAAWAGEVRLIDNLRMQTP
ncbi:MAG: pantoate--beta-alanine ligase [Bacteroidales bacterium]